MSLLETQSATSAALPLSECGVCEAESFEEEVLRLFTLMRLRLLRYAISLGIPIPDGEDVVQETFLALFHHLQDGRPRDNLCGWLFRVTHNIALKKRATRIREVTSLTCEEAERFDPEDNPEECILVAERHLKLQSIVRALPLKDQWCLRLRAEGLRYREISKVVGISLGGVSASLSRSLARLQEADRR